MAINAMCLFGVHDGHSKSSQFVFFRRNYFEMRRIDAFTIPAKMIDFHSKGNRSAEHLIGTSVCIFTAKLGIPAAINVPLPLPTSSGIGFDATPKVEFPTHFDALAAVNAAVGVFSAAKSLVRAAC